MYKINVFLQIKESSLKMKTDRIPTLHLANVGCSTMYFKDNTIEKYLAKCLGHKSSTGTVRRLFHQKLYDLYIYAR